MKIALLGYGKMGKIIETIALERGHSVVLKIGKSNQADLNAEHLKKADVAIEFSTPATAVNHITACFDAGIPVIAGTTGWYDQMEYMAEQCKQKQGAIFHASNFSLGVNLFFRLNKTLATLMNPHTEYDVTMEEIHHVHKLDSPSGTAITIADGILAALDRKTSWKDYEGSARGYIPAEELPIVSKRIGEVPGTHSVTYKSAVDQITITHEAFNRQGFALGSVVAAEWMKGRKGIFGMNDLLA